MSLMYHISWFKRWYCMNNNFTHYMHDFTVLIKQLCRVTCFQRRHQEWSVHDSLVKDTSPLSSYMHQLQAIATKLSTTFIKCCSKPSTASYKEISRSKWVTSVLQVGSDTKWNTGTGRDQWIKEASAFSNFAGLKSLPSLTLCSATSHQENGPGCQLVIECSSWSNSSWSIGDGEAAPTTHSATDHLQRRWTMKD